MLWLHLYNGWRYIRRNDNNIVSIAERHTVVVSTVRRGREGSSDCGRVVIEEQQTNKHPFNGHFSKLPGWAGTRKVKPLWISLEQETVSGSGIRWTICKSAPSSREITTPATHHLVFYRPDALPAAQPTASKHWRTDRGKWCITKSSRHCAKNGDVL